jgi:hemerythrin
MQSRTADHYLLTWQPEYSVHIESIDSQHQVLVGMIRQLQEAMEEGRGRTFQSTLIAQLAAYTQVHFRFEEELMRQHGYDALAEHIALHNSLTGQVSELQQRIDQGRIVSNAALMLFLRNWLTDHIMQHDQKYARALSIGSGATECAPSSD